MSYQNITDYLTESNEENLIENGGVDLLDVEDMVNEAAEEFAGFDKELEDLQFFNQDHTNNLDNDFVDNLDPDNTDAINNGDGDEELESGMEIVTMSESASLLEELLSFNEADVTSNDLPDADDDGENPQENPLDKMSDDDTFDTTDLEEY